MATLVLTAIGDDRAGLVDALAGPIAAHGGNWDRSHMARLAGQFAGIVVVTIADEHVADLGTHLAALRAQGLLDVQIAVAANDVEADAATFMQLHLVGLDRPGIISEIAGALALSEVSIEELETSTLSAPMSAEQLFEATATLRVPDGVDVTAVRTTLESVANELMVDLEFSDPADSNHPSVRGGGDDDE